MKMKDIKYIENMMIRGTKRILNNNNIALDTKVKGFQDLVTKKDVLMENFLIDGLKHRFKDYKIISEEKVNEALTEALTWVIDPIDGTINFAQGSPLFGIQIALLKKKEPIFSAMYFPKFQSFHYSVKNEGYYMEGKKIELCQSRKLEDSIITFGDFSKSNPSSRKHQLTFIEHVMDQCLKTRIQGSSSIDFSFVASGKTQAHIIFSKNIWELKPGFLMVEEAGGIVEEYSGSQYDFEGKGYIVASNQKILNSLKDILDKI